MPWSAREFLNDPEASPKTVVPIQLNMPRSHGVSFPFLSLTVSGGHTSLYLVREIGDYLLCRNTVGVQGWVPAACVHDLEEEP